MLAAARGHLPLTFSDAASDGLERGEGSGLALAWFWDAYAPELQRRGEPYASPLRAAGEQLAKVPPAFVIVDEADVLRDEGEAFAARLRAAGDAVTTVRYDGVIHDLMMLNPFSATQATRAAITQATAVLRGALRGA